MTRIPLAARIAFVTSGVAFAAYPILRPWASESDPQTFATMAWPIAHTLGMIGFVALAVGYRSLAARPTLRWTGRSIREVETRAWLAAGFLLPYYGAEAFALNALGRYSADHHDNAALAVANDFRYAAIPMTVFGIGLLLLLLVGGRTIHGFWRTGTLGRTGGLLAGIALMTYLPQFFAPGPVRIAHGLVLAAGLILLGTARVNENAS